MFRPRDFQRFMASFLLLFIFPEAVAVVFSAEAHNVKRIGYCDLQGRDALQIVLQGNFAYIGHHRGEELNPMTGKKEVNGTSYLAVSRKNSGNCRFMRGSVAQLK